MMETIKEIKARSVLRFCTWYTPVNGVSVSTNDGVYRTWRYSATVNIEAHLLNERNEVTLKQLVHNAIGEINNHQLSTLDTFVYKRPDSVTSRRNMAIIAGGAGAFDILKHDLFVPKHYDVDFSNDERIGRWDGVPVYRVDSDGAWQFDTSLAKVWNIHVDYTEHTEQTTENIARDGEIRHKVLTVDILGGLKPS